MNFMGYDNHIVYVTVKTMIEELQEGFNMQQQISENISRFRQNQNMTQDEFASRLGVTPQAVSKWERGVSLR